MKLKLSSSAVAVLNNMLREPMKLPLQRAGMTQSNGMPKEFQSQDPKHAKKVATLRKWLEEKVFEKETTIKEGKEVAASFVFKDFEGSLLNSYCEIVLDVLRFYQPVGMLVEMSTVYTELLDAFEGRSNSADSIDDITRDSEEPSKISKLEDAKNQREA